MLSVSRLAVFCTAFSGILPCVLRHFTLHLAPKRTAFSGILHCYLPQNAPHFATNSPKFDANGHSI